MPVAKDVIHRTELPIDDRPHGIDLTGDILHAAVRRFGSVDVWYVARQDSQQHMRRSFQIVGTGQPFPPGLDATTPRPSPRTVSWCGTSLRTTARTRCQRQRT